MTSVALLFDLDGTLLDSAPEFVYCINVLLQQEGREPIELLPFRSIVSLGVKGMITYAFKLSEQDPNVPPLIQRMLQLYQQHLGSYSQLFPGTTELLLRLEQLNIPWGIVTNKHEIFTQQIVQHFKPLHPAACVISGDTLGVQKPDPTPLLHACKILNVPPSICWYIGDARTDVQASRAANMRCAIANYGYIPAQEDPKEWQADIYMEKVQDIESLLY